MPMPDIPALPRTVIIDYYDSYTNNILTLFTKLYSDEEVLKKVVVIKADRYTWDEFQSEVLPNTDCMILSPGPGRPDTPSDIGFALKLLKEHPVPILGVCLGHQAIGVAFGAKIINTPKITHGHVISVSPVEPISGLFATPAWKSGGDGPFEVVVYNSLTIDPKSITDDLEVTAWSADTGKGEERTVQGLRHKKYPIWGVQYHPESISSTRGCSLILSFLSLVHQHSSQPRQYRPLPDHVISSCSYRVTASSSSTRRAKPGRGTPTISPYPTPPISRASSSASIDRPTEASTSAMNGSPASRGDHDALRLDLSEKRFGDLSRDVQTADVFQAVIRSRKGKEKAIGEVWLDGETPTRPTTTSISSPSFLVTYNLSRRRITLHRSSHPPTYHHLDEETFWDYFGDGQKLLSASLESTSRPDERSKEGGASCKGPDGFKGGWVGWFGYEMKRESLAGYPRRPKNDTEEGGDGEEEIDAAMAWCDRILERRPDGEWIARGIISETRAGNVQNDQDHDVDGLVGWLQCYGVEFGISQSEFATWASEVESTLCSTPSPSVSPAPTFPDFTPISNGLEYQRQIGICREAIRQGESYELTLTTKFTASLPTHPTDPLSLYLRLRSSNPAYYSTYLSFPTLDTSTGKGLSVISSSPERFLKIERGVVEMMPIKGTRARIKPGMCVCGEVAEGGVCQGGDICAEIAKKEDARRGEELRLDPKERAENLMIVDLIRSDLLSSCPPSTVVVPKLIALESYGVHNLVTTVRGQIAPNVGVVEAVKRCFPPGSMTGAPKLRSVRLLEGIEDNGDRRGIYSGCLGYFSLDGTTDLSVVIRTMIMEGNQLSLGAGGAITWLSDPEKEWEEVLTKVRSVVGNLAGVK